MQSGSVSLPGLSEADQEQNKPDFLNTVLHHIPRLLKGRSSLDCRPPNLKDSLRSGQAHTPNSSNERDSEAYALGMWRG